MHRNDIISGHDCKHSLRVIRERECNCNVTCKSLFLILFLSKICYIIIKNDKQNKYN